VIDKALDLIVTPSKTSKKSDTVLLLEEHYKFSEDNTLEAMKTAFWLWYETRPAVAFYGLLMPFMIGWYEFSVLIDPSLADESRTESESTLYKYLMSLC
jgi:hypothetical protein